MLFARKAKIFSGWIVIKLCTTIDFYFSYIDMLMQDVRPFIWPMFMGHRFYIILVLEYVFWFASYTRKHGGICWQPKLSSIKICGINAKMSSLAPKLIFYTSLACICIVQDPGIVARHIKHYLQRDTKMSQNRFQDGVKLLIWMHQDEALIETIETDIWMTLFRVRMRKLWWCEVCYPAKTG
jgi:hypothetical protein